MQAQIRESRVFCGKDFVDTDFYPVFRKQGVRGRRGRPTSEVQEKLNQRNAEKKLERLILTNFSARDLEVHLTYRDDVMPEDEARAQIELKKFFRRVRRYIRQFVPEHQPGDLKYIYVTEGGVDGKRIHHHVTVSGFLPREVLETLWGNGYANARRLQFRRDGIPGLVAYITKQWRGERERTAGKRRWSSSTNLEKPVEKTRDGVISARTLKKAADGEAAAITQILKRYPGYTAERVETILNPVNHAPYIHIRFCRIGADFSSGTETGERRREKKK